MSVEPRDAGLYNHRDLVPITRALISVSDKTGLLELGEALAKRNVEIVSTGSTAKILNAAGIPVVEVQEVTGFPEMLDGRVKTLHPAVHGGILADLRLEDHKQQLREHGIFAFDLVVVNLYPFLQTVKSGADAAKVIENIDIGGPAMVRAAAKNHANVAIVTSPNQYAKVVTALNAGGTTLSERTELATAAFAHTAEYDSAVASWFAGEFDHSRGEVSADSSFATSLDISAQKLADLRYGENSHQRAALYSTGKPGLANATILGGKEMSYNNYVDVDAAIRAAYDFNEPAVAIIKHANPCGIAIADPKSDDPIASAYQRAHETDPVSAFGGVVASNRPISVKMAKALAEVFTEVVAAPGFGPGALEVLQSKKNLRILLLPAEFGRDAVEVRQIAGGFLAQTPDNFVGFSSVKWQRVSGNPADDATLADLEFAWRAVRSVKSNAILLAKDLAAVGVGMGQVNRVDSARLAVSRAGARSRGAVAASDAFFPFADGLEILLEAGVKAIVQPGGSVRDEEVVAAATVAGVTMYFTGERHFFH